MESLLCDEVWPSSPTTVTYDDHTHTKHWGSNSYCGNSTKEDFEEALTICLDNEMSYMPEPNYLENLCCNDLVIARFKSIHWFIKCGSRFNLSLGTVFYAANYLDRFLSMHPCNGWEYWMVELVSVACLSIASKFTDTCTPSLLEIQMEDLDHSFEPSTIQQMEMMLLKALGWRIASTTAYSFIELLTWRALDSFQPHQLQLQLINRVEKLLLGAISDSKLVKFRPSILAISAIKCSLDKLQISTHSDAYITCLTSLLDHELKGELVKCQKMMEGQSVDSLVEVNNFIAAHGVFNYCPSSPTTVLLKERNIPHFHGFHVDFSLFTMRPQSMRTDILDSRMIKKRKREEDD